jgi:hypothetical protein
MLGALRPGVPKPCAQPAGPAPSLTLLLPEQPRSQAEPEEAPRRAPAAVAAARLTPGRAEPPARRRGPAPPRAPIGQARRIKGEADRGGAGRGGACAPGAGRRGRGWSLHPARCCGLRPGARVGTWCRGSGQQANWDGQPLGAALGRTAASSLADRAFPPLCISPEWQDRTQRLQFTGGDTEVGRASIALAQTSGAPLRHCPFPVFPRPACIKCSCISLPMLL